MNSAVTNTPIDQRGAGEEEADYRSGGTYHYSDFRDIAHPIRGSARHYPLLAPVEVGRLSRVALRYGARLSREWIALYNRRT